jgi:hypothetical protein
MSDHPGFLDERLGGVGVGVDRVPRLRADPAMNLPCAQGKAAFPPAAGRVQIREILILRGETERFG